MSLREITGAAARAVTDTYFNIKDMPGISVLVHEIICADGISVGYVASEDMKTVVGPHIYIAPAYHTRERMTEVGALFKTAYIPLMKERGVIALCTNCSQSDRGTTNFLEKCGFTLKKLVVAEYVL